jgi:hypothetical protein
MDYETVDLEAVLGEMAADRSFSRKLQAEEAVQQFIREIKGCLQ